MILREQLFDNNDPARQAVLEAFLDADIKLCQPKTYSSSMVYDYHERKLKELKVVFDDFGTFETEYVELGRGEPGEILAFILETQPQRYLDVVKAMATLDELSVEQLGWQGFLDKCRELRQTNRALNNITKIVELKTADGDFVGLDFPLAVDDSAVYVSCDEERPDVPWTLQLVHDFSPDKFDENMEGRTIVGNVVRGDSAGARANDGRLLARLYKASSHNEVYVKMYADMRQRYRGYIIRKPRPHNMVFVVSLDPNGDLLWRQFKEFEPHFERVNLKRNARYFNEYEPVVVGPTFTMLELTQLVRRVDLNGLTHQQLLNRKKLKGEQVNLCLERRQQKFAEICNNPNAVQMSREWPYMLLEMDFFGDVIFNDVGIMTVEFSFASVVRTAIAKGKYLTFDGTWKIVS